MHGQAIAQPLLETGAQQMPREWIDKDTKHKVIRLTEGPGENSSFYFHNNPFIGNTMVYYHTGENGRQLYALDLATRQVTPLTQYPGRIFGEITAPKTRKVYFQCGDSVMATHIDTKKTELIFRFPENFRGSITTVNADETLLGGVYATEAERELFRRNPQKSSYFNIIYEAKLPRTLFVIDIQTKALRKIHTDSAWLNHVQFSPADPALLMFCHEGPWHLVDRIWTINVHTRAVKLMHRRTVEREIAGHEFFSRDGKRYGLICRYPGV